MAAATKQKTSTNGATALKLKNVPQLQLARGGRAAAAKPEYDPSKQYNFRYDSKRHKDLPHVVKFSGGRSSGMLLFTLLESGILNAERGDVIVFNNTSAEHPATYAYAAQCKEVAEQQYGIPFFWTEFQTYEDAANGDWRRFPSYRLVNTKPVSEQNTFGYHAKGEVFEELMSLKRFVPTRFQRVCTQDMKIFVTQEFLRDWFACKQGIERLGHWYGKRMLNDQAIIRLHGKHGGITPSEVLLEKAAYVRTRPYIREEQPYGDFSDCIKPIANPALRGKSFGARTALSGQHGVDYVTFVGFRADEMARVHRMKARNYGDKGNDIAAGDPHLSAPECEYVYAPLETMGIAKSHVTRFWQQQKWDLALPANVNLSNCVFCFLKGTRALAGILASQDEVNNALPDNLRPQKGTPADINWWMEMEEKYGRDLEKEGRTIRNAEKLNAEKVIGFWGIDGKMTYSRLAASQRSPAALAQIGEENAALPCDCTD